MPPGFEEWWRSEPWRKKSWYARTKIFATLAPQAMLDIWKHVFGNKSPGQVLAYVSFFLLLLCLIFVKQLTYSRTDRLFQAWTWFLLGFILFAGIFAVPAAFYLIDKRGARKNPGDKQGRTRLKN